MRKLSLEHLRTAAAEPCETWYSPWHIPAPANIQDQNTPVLAFTGLNIFSLLKKNKSVLKKKFSIYFSPARQQRSGRAGPARREATERGGVPRGGGGGLCVMSSSDLSPGNASPNHLDPICDAGSPGPPAFPSPLPPPGSLRPTAAAAQGPASLQSLHPGAAPPSPHPAVPAPH